MKKKGADDLIMKKHLALVAVLTLLLTVLLTTPIEADEIKPIIVCTTNAVGSIVREYIEDYADVVVLVRPSLCPADFDMKPSDIYAVSNAKMLFKQNVPGEFWLQDLLDAAGNTNLTQVAIPGAHYTPQGAKKYIEWVGGNLSKTLDIDLEDKISAMVADVDEVSSWMTSQSQALQTSSVKVICMKWLKVFVESAGFQVVAIFNPPETLSAGDIIDLVNTAQSEGVALIVDNMQIDAEFGGGIAEQVGAEHVVLTNFPGAIPNTENLHKMLRYNAEQLYKGLNTWRSTSTLRAERDQLTNQVTTYQIATALASIIAIVEAVWLYMGRKRT